MLKKIILWSLVAIWLIVIFNFSAMNSSESDEQSKSFITNTIEGTIQVTDNLGITEINPTPNEVTQIVDQLNHPLRKVAHATVYFVLAILLLLALRTIPLTYAKQITITIILCFLYSLTDEWHQTFINGRSGQFIDCLIDTFGAMIACGTFTLFLMLKKRMGNRINEKQKS